MLDFLIQRFISYTVNACAREIERNVASVDERRAITNVNTANIFPCTLFLSKSAVIVVTRAQAK